jgi:hypothetical protein
MQKVESTADHELAALVGRRISLEVVHEPQPSDRKLLVENKLRQAIRQAR